MQFDKLFISGNHQEVIDFMILLKTDLEQLNKKYPSEMDILYKDQGDKYCIYTSRDITIIIINNAILELERFIIEYQKQASICYALVQIYRAKFCLEFYDTIEICEFYKRAIEIILQLRQKTVPPSTYDYEIAHNAYNDIKIKYKLYQKVGFCYNFKTELDTENSMEF